MRRNTGNDGEQEVIEAVPVRTGRREQAKADRRERLKAAALAVFTEHGYEAATTREIARRAGIGEGTLFRYAEKKRDLLLMIVNDRLETINRQVLAKIDYSAPLIDQVMEYFAPRIRYWAGHLEIAREAFHATMIARATRDPSPEARRYTQRDRLFDILVDIVRRQQSCGVIDPSLDPSTVALLFHTIQLSQISLWLGEPHPQGKKGIAQLRQMLELAIKGIRKR